MTDSKTERFATNEGGLVVIWVILVFVLTIIGAFPLILGGLNLNDLPEASPLLPFVFAGIVVTAYAPTLAALLVGAGWPGAGGWRTQWRQFGIGRVRISWYALALIGPIVIILLAVAIDAAVSGVLPEKWLVIPSLSAAMSLVGPLIAGSLGEEPGWRGFALPRLQKLCGALSASIVIGVIWSTWHLWPVMTPGGDAELTTSNLVQTYVRLIATSIIYAWMYNSTKGSLCLVMVAHAGHNIAIDLIQVPADRRAAVSVITALVYLAATIPILLTTNPQTLTRCDKNE